MIITDNDGGTISPSISVSQKTIKQRETLAISGIGFTPGGKVNIGIDGLATQGSAANPSGISESSLYVGENVPLGNQSVWMQDVATGKNSNVATVTVLAPTPVYVTPTNPDYTPPPTTQASGVIASTWAAIKPYAPYLVGAIVLATILVIAPRK